LSVGKISASKNRGFTLLELIVVLVIISLTSALAVPQLTGALSGTNSKTAAKKIAASLRYARSRAVSEKIIYIVILNTDKNRLTLMSATKAELSSEEHSDKAKVYVLPEGLTLKSGIELEKDKEEFRIAFYPSGSSSGGEVIVSDEREKTYKIRVDFITGTVQVSDS